MADEPSKPGSAVATVKRSRLPSTSFVVRNTTEALEMAKVMAVSDLVPVQYLRATNPVANIAVAIMYGAKFGLDPFQSVNSIAVINGRPAMWGDAVLAIVMDSGLLEDIDERKADDSLAAGQGSCTVKRKNMPRPTTRTFSMDEANRAGLIERSRGSGKGDGPWITYPGRMLQMRARAFALRDLFPDVLRGMRIVEEENDIKDAEYSVHPTEPKGPEKPPIQRLSDVGGGILPGAADELRKASGGAGGGAPGGGGGAPRGAAPAVKSEPSGKVKVVVLDVKRETKGTAKWWNITVKPEGAEKPIVPSTFSDSLAEIAATLRTNGQKGIAQFSETVKGGTKYLNIIALEPDIAVDDGVPPEPGANG